MQIRPVVQQSPIRGGGTTPEGSTGVSADPVRAERIGFEVKTLRWLSESRRRMKSELICVMVVCVCGVCWEQHVSDPPASTLHVRAGEDVTLHCPLLDVFNATNITSTTSPPGTTSPGPAPFMISWYRKVRGQRPELLLSFSSTNHSEVRFSKTRVRLRKVSWGSDGSLRLHASQRSDEAVYYCGISQKEGMEKGRAETSDLMWTEQVQV